MLLASTTAMIPDAPSWFSTLSPTSKSPALNVAVVSSVNILISKRYKSAVSDAFCPETSLTLSMCLALQKPICVPADALSVAFFKVNNLIGSKASVFVLSAISGNECMLFILNLFPILTGVDAAETDAVVLALSSTRFVVPILSISKPLTYALPGDT